MNIESELHASGDGKTIEMTLTLSREEFEAMQLMLGMVCAALSREVVTELSFAVLRLVNRIMAGRPDWVPFWTPEIERRKAAQ